jgi:hypothetical protein
MRSAALDVDLDWPDVDSLDLNWLDSNWLDLERLVLPADFHDFPAERRLRVFLVRPPGDNLRSQIMRMQESPG